MNQASNNRLIKNILQKHFFGEIRFIKIHGSKYQEAGIPDILCLVKGGPNFWLEVKRDWKDEPTKLQKWNVDNLRNYSFVTGFVAGKEYKKNWNDTAIDFEEMICKLSQAR